MTERERLFDRCVDQIYSGRLTLDQCIALHASDDPDLADRLRTVEVLRGPTIPELRAARLRVRSRLEDAMNQDVADATGGGRVRGARPGALATPRSGSRPSFRHGLEGLAAAVLLACGLLGWGTAQAAANVLPGNPLYAVKRAEEWVMLQTAFGDARHGVTLATLANRRLAEASAEAHAGNASQARALLREYDDDMRQAVVLSVAMESHGEDDRSVLVAVAVDLAQAQQLQAEAASQGNGAFAQLVQTSVASDQKMIRDNHLALPDVTVTPNGQGQSNPPPGSRGRQGTATAAPSSSSTPTSNGNGDGHGHATPTPPSTPPGH